MARLSAICSTYARPVFSTAFGPEGIALMHLIAVNKLPVEVVTLDTLLLHEETLELRDKLMRQLDMAVRVVKPEPERVVWLERQQGRYGMYDSLDARQRCCDVRKVDPLRLALQGADAWLTGLRRSHSDDRSHVPESEPDQRSGLPKFNPVFDWTDGEVQAYLLDHALPQNALHRKGYLSIGCEPCTRAVRPGEDSRAGRWWWERGTAKECGLHVATAR